jgi:uncharacterized protein (DUF1501 family)
MNRRNFIKTSACFASALGLKLGALPLLAQQNSGYKAIVVINLEGGNDGNSVLLPLTTQGYSQYALARGSAAVPQSNLIPLVTGQGNFGIHPSLAPLNSLFSEGKVAFVANVGNLVVPTSRADYLDNSVPVPPNVFGHDGGQNMFQTAGDGSVDAPYGWGGLLADNFGSSSSVSPLISLGGISTFGTGSTVTALSFNGSQIPSLMGFDNSSASSARMEALNQIINNATGSVLQDATNAIIVSAQKQSQILSSALSANPKLQTTFPKSALSSQLQMVASIMQARETLGVSKQIFYCTVGGYDLHSGILNGATALLSDLAKSMAAFQQALGEIGVNEDVFTLTISEFSRTLQLNNSAGADHAWGSNHMIMGDPVKGGKIYGIYPSLELGGPDDSGSLGVWIPTTSVSQYVSPAASWFGLSPSSTNQVFPVLSSFPSGPVQYLG